MRKENELLIYHDYIRGKDKETIQRNKKKIFCHLKKEGRSRGWVWMGNIEVENVELEGICSRWC